MTTSPPGCGWVARRLSGAGCGGGSWGQRDPPIRTCHTTHAGLHMFFFLSWAKISHVVCYSVCLCLCMSAIEFLELKFLCRNRLQITSKNEIELLDSLCKLKQIWWPPIRIWCIHWVLSTPDFVICHLWRLDTSSPEWWICQYCYDRPSVYSGCFQTWVYQVFQAQQQQLVHQCMDPPNLCSNDQRSHQNTFTI